MLIGTVDIKNSENFFPGGQEGQKNSPTPKKRSDYYPFGLQMPGRTQNASNPNDDAKFKGYLLEQQGDLGVYHAEARLYDPVVGRFMQTDPLAEERPGYTPYNYVRNNPLIFIDPTGLLDDFALNKETGELTLVRETDDDFDRIVRTDKDGNVKTKGSGFLGFLVRGSKKGEAKVDIDNVEKRILKDGMNLKTEGNFIDIGGEGQASTKGVDDFLVQLSDHLNKEIAGFELSKKGQSDISHVFIGGFANNTAQSSTAGLNFSTRPELMGNVTARTSFHTHLSRFDSRSRFSPSGADRQFKRNQLEINSTLKFFILTNKGRIPF